MIAELAGSYTYLGIYVVFDPTDAKPHDPRYSQADKQSSQSGHARRKGSVTELQDCGGQHEYENKL